MECIRGFSETIRDFSVSLPDFSASLPDFSVKWSDFGFKNELDKKNQHRLCPWQCQDFLGFRKQSKNPMFNTRMDLLEKSINKHIDRINKEENTELVEIHHTLYDEEV